MSLEIKFYIFCVKQLLELIKDIVQDILSHGIFVPVCKNPAYAITINYILRLFHSLISHYLYSTFVYYIFQKKYDCFEICFGWKQIYLHLYIHYTVYKLYTYTYLTYKCIQPMIFKIFLTTWFIRKVVSLARCECIYMFSRDEKCAIIIIKYSKVFNFFFFTFLVGVAVIFL